MAVSAFEVFEKEKRKRKIEQEEQEDSDNICRPKKRSSKKRTSTHVSSRRIETESEDTELNRFNSVSAADPKVERKRKYTKWVQQRQAEMKAAKAETERRKAILRQAPKSPEYKITPDIDIPFKEQFHPDRYKDSRNAAGALFELLIHPYSPDEFLKKVWERKPLLIQRDSPSYNTGWFSSQELTTILQENDVEHGVSIKMSSYVDGEKELEDIKGRAYASTVWDRFQSGCSVQFLNPQSYSNSMWLLTSTLQEHFGSFVGANIYVTPPDSQGFAPHYDDIEAFVLQIEGKKNWRIYQPIKTLPQFSSRDFSQDEIGEPIQNVTLEPGDFLYFPRGFIHQAVTVPGHHSLHITLSTCQRNTWGDLLERWLGKALKASIEEDGELRQSLPWDYMDYTGSVHIDSDDERAKAFYLKLQDFLSRLGSNPFPLVSAVDEMAVDFLHASLPPCLTEKEKEVTVLHNNPTEKDKPWSNVRPITLNSRIKLSRNKAIRLVGGISCNDEEQGTILYYSTGNSRIYKERDPLGINIEEDADEATIRRLIKRYPLCTAVRDLPMDTDEKKVSLCNTLYEQGIIMAYD